MAVKEKPVHVRAKSLPKPPVKDGIADACLRLCYHYPQYTLKEALELPFDHVLMLLERADKEMAAHYLNMLNVSAAPHTKKMQGVKRMSSEYKRIIDG